MKKWTEIQGSLTPESISLPLIILTNSKHENKHHLGGNIVLNEWENINSKIVSLQLGMTKKKSTVIRI